MTLAPLLLFSSSAQAHDHPPQHSRAAKAAPYRASTWRVAHRAGTRDDPVALATVVAERYWGSVPCGGQFTVRAYAPLFPGLDPTTDAWATFASSLGPNDLAAPASSYTQCTISLSRSQWRTPAEVRSGWNMFCLTVIHELGHLLGHAHSDAPGSVMAPLFTDEKSVPSLCRASRRAADDVAPRRSSA